MSLNAPLTEKWSLRLLPAVSQRWIVSSSNTYDVGKRRLDPLDASMSCEENRKLTQFTVNRIYYVYVCTVDSLYVLSNFVNYELYHLMNYVV